jgi:hypothetical protein
MPDDVIRDRPEDERDTGRVRDDYPAGTAPVVAAWMAVTATV